MNIYKTLSFIYKTVSFIYKTLSFIYKTLSLKYIGHKKIVFLDKTYVVDVRGNLS